MPHPPIPRYLNYTVYRRPDGTPAYATITFPDGDPGHKAIRARLPATLTLEQSVAGYRITPAVELADVGDLLAAIGTLATAYGLSRRSFGDMTLGE